MFSTGFDNSKEAQDKLKLTSVETTIIKTERVLRYDFKIKNTSSYDIQQTFDYPGYHHYGIEVIVKPEESLESLMEMEKRTKYKKMRHTGSGGRGMFPKNTEARFYIECKINETSNLERVKSAALEGTLLILDGPKVIAQIPLKN